MSTMFIGCQTAWCQIYRRVAQRPIRIQAINPCGTLDIGSESISTLSLLHVRVIPNVVPYTNRPGLNAE